MNTVLNEKETKSFYHRDIARALESCLKEGYHPLSMLELADVRIQAPGDHELWKNWFTTPSLRATGRTPQGKPVVLYAHTTNHFSNPENITKANKEGLISYAGRLPQEEFERLLSLEGKTDEAGNHLVCVIDHDELKRSASGVIPVSEALKHPQTIPFLGGKERAEQYLKRHQEVFGSRIGVWHCDDLGKVPVARLLYLGSSDGDGLGGYGSLLLRWPVLRGTSCERSEQKRRSRAKN